MRWNTQLLARNKGLWGVVLTLLLMSLVIPFVPSTAVAAPVTTAATLPQSASGVSWNYQSSTPMAVTATTGWAKYYLLNGATSNALYGTNYGFDIPADAVIDGIQATIIKQAGTGLTFRDSEVYLTKNGTAGAGSNLALTSANDYWPILSAPITYGSSSNLWGTTWTAADINSANFGLFMKVRCYAGTGRTAWVGDYTISVTYHIEPTVLTVASANQPAGSSLVGPGTTHAVDGFTLERSAGGAPLSVSDVTIEDTGTAPAADVVSGVRVYRDNGDSMFGTGDVLLNMAPGLFTGTSALVTFDTSESVTAAAQYWVVYEFGDTTPVTGDTASSRVSAVTQSGAASVTQDAVVGSTFTVDTHGPDLAILSPMSDEMLFANPSQILGTVTDIAGVASAEVRITRAADGKVWDGAAWTVTDTWLPAALEATGSVSTTFSYDWAIDPTVQDGSPAYDIDAQAVNPIGPKNLGHAATATNVKLDNSPPTVAVTSVSDNDVLVGSSAEIGGTASDASGITGTSLTIQRDSDGAYWDGSAFVAGSAIHLMVTGTTTWTYQWDFSPASQNGTPTYTIQAFASDGHMEGASLPVTGVSVDNSYIINASAGANGTIDPTGTVLVLGGTSQSFVFTPSPHYHVATLAIGDGAAETTSAVGYLFENVSADSTITVAFAIDTFTLDYSAGLGGSIEGSSTQVVEYSTSGTEVVAKPDAGYSFKSWSDGSTTATRTDSDVIADLSVVASFTKDATVTSVASDKVYDRSADASVTLSSTDIDPADAVTIGFTSAQFADMSVGGGKVVTVSGISLSGPDAGKYSLASSTCTTTAAITAKGLTIAGAVADNKVYDGTTDAIVDFSAATLTDVLLDDVVSLDASAYTASFDTKDAVADKSVTVDGVAIAGTDAGNYAVVQPVGLTAEITARPITVSADDASKLVGNDDPALTYAVTNGSLVAGDLFNGALARSSGETTGTYPITQGTLALTSDYDLGFVGATFTIADRPLAQLGSSTRYSTAVATAQDVYPGWAGVTHVVLASGEDRAQPDALTAAGLAGVLDAPLLLVSPTSVDSVIENAIKSMPAGVRVHIVGGTISVSATVADQLRAYTNVGSVDRTEGPNRYATAAAVARRMKTELEARSETLPATALITNGSSSAAMFDALAASAISAHNYFPILLVRNDSVPGETAAALADLGLTQRYIIGGPVAVSDGVAGTLGVATGDRIAGANRFATATAAATRAKSEGWLSNFSVGFAARIPDAATGGAFMGKKDGALVYVTSTGVPSDTVQYLNDARVFIDEGVIFGGTVAVPESVRTQLFGLIN